MQDIDLITVGRCCVDLYGQQVGARLQDTETFSRSVGGSPTNTAIGAARLGLRVGVVTAVGGEEMGGFIAEQLAREGVCLDGLKVDPRRQTAITLLGLADDRTFPHIFYRQDCADMGLTEDDVDPSFIARGRALLVSGTHFSTPAVSAMSSKAIRLAREAGARIALDVDHRPTLWTSGPGRVALDGMPFHEATALLQSVVPSCDLVVGTEDELRLLGGSDDLQASLERIRALTAALIVCKMGERGCVAFPGPVGRGGGVAGEGFEVAVLNTLGAGDAFMAGFLSGWLRGDTLERCCTLANGAGAIAVSRLLCSREYPSAAELAHFISAPSGPRRDPVLSHLHRAATRRPIDPTIRALAIDHRVQLRQVADALGAPAERLVGFKRIAVEAAARVAGGRAGYGMLLDDTYGRPALFDAAARGLWIGRPVERQGSRPLRFEVDDLGSHLVAWPATHTVKCLCYYHPDDPDELKADQEEKLMTLADAARTVGREYIVEIIASRHGEVDATTVSRVLSRLYDVGLRPDWWKLEPQDTAEAWGPVEAVIRGNDPLCRGVMILGLDAPEDQLLRAFQAAAQVDIVKGFAIGRSIFSGVLQDWLKGAMTDDEALSELGARFARLSDAWDQVIAARASGSRLRHGGAALADSRDSPT